MNKDDILIIKYPFLMKNDQATKLYESILKQKENGVIILPDYCEVVIAQKDAEIKTETRMPNWMTDGREFERG